MSVEPPAPPKNKKKLLLLVGGAMVLLVAIGGGLWASGMLGGTAEASEGAAAEGEGHGDAAAAEGEGHGDATVDAGAEGHGEATAHGEAGSPGEAVSHVPAAGAAAIGAGMVGTAVDSTITSLGTFTVNLRGSGGGRVLRMEVQLDADEAAAATITARAPQLRDTVITAVSDYTWSELEGVDGKTRLRDELLARLNGVLAPQVADRLYFTQFVVQ